jgi:hypothetical protein
MRVFSILLASACALAGTSAAAQWMWLDKDGHKVFSDRSPPVDIPAKNILKQPGMPARVPSEPLVSEKPPQAPAADPTVAGKPSALDKAVQEKKRLAEAAQAEQKRAEQERVEREKAQNCANAQQNMRTFDSGIRIARVNDQGERVVLDDDARAAELAKAQAAISANCH